MNYNGLVVVNAKNASFNAGFDGLPRRLPNGKIFATDKALKYCIREYLSGDKAVFVQRSKELQEITEEQEKLKKYAYLTLEENYLQKCNKEELPKDESVVLNDLKSFIDVRLFGVVFAVKKYNFSITGPCQISYGINQYDNSSIYSSYILSPYKNSNEESKDKKQTTSGSQSRADDVYYVYDVCLNLNSAKKQGIDISDSDIEKLKNALKYSVAGVNSTTMFGCETVSMIWFENKDNYIFNNLNSQVNVYESEGKVIVNYSKVYNIIKDRINKESLEQYSNKVENIGLSNGQ